MSQTHETVEFEKYHGTGNDFVVVDATDHVPDRAAFAREHCDRETGVGDAAGRRGADGVLFLALEEQYAEPRVVLTLVQPDGSVAAMCGNGARVAAVWAARRTGARRLMIDTPAGSRRATVHDDSAGSSVTVTIEMGVPSFEPDAVPLARDAPLVEEGIEGLTVTAVNTGVPHAVAFVDDVDAVDLDEVAPPVRQADVFPEGANVNLAAPAEGTAADDGTADAFRQRTFERGVEGETRSCGTGAVAVAAVARRTGRLAGDTVRVSPPGGELEVTVSDRSDATLHGPVEVEFDGELPVSPER